MKPALRTVFCALYRRFGPQHWWPGETRFEIMAGAILTQNAAWANAEKAISSLKQAGALTPRGIAALKTARLAALIRPAGCCNVKARRLAEFTRYFTRRYHGSAAAMARRDVHDVRAELLAVRGIGPETADSILLYALGKPVFVVDAYTRRMLSRHGLAEDTDSYDAVQRLFTAAFPPFRGRERARLCGRVRSLADIFNEYHALIVRLGKEYCRKRQPDCARCPLSDGRARRQ